MIALCLVLVDIAGGSKSFFVDSMGSNMVVVVMNSLDNSIIFRYVFIVLYIYSLLTCIIDVIIGEILED